MEKTVAGLLGAMTALGIASPGQAATAPPASIDAAMQASSYADLLAPIPNALELLKVAAQAPALPELPAAGEAPGVQTVQYRHHHHHHHHHHRWRRRYWRHHHWIYGY